MGTDIFFQYNRSPIDIIKRYQSDQVGIVYNKSLVFNDLKVSLGVQNKHFELRGENELPNSFLQRIHAGQTYKKVFFASKDTTLILADVFISNVGYPTRFTGSVDVFYTKGYSTRQQYYYRLFIPIHRKLSLNNKIESRIFSTDLGYTSSSGTIAIINCETLFVSLVDVKEDNQFFLVIESRTKQTFEAFSEKSFAVKNSLGYLTGYVAGGNGWFFAYTNSKMNDIKHYYFATLRDTIDSAYIPVNTNPHSFLHHKNKSAEALYKRDILKIITIEQFSNLCQKIHDSVTFSSVLMLIMESSVGSLLLMPGGYSIALESLSDIIIHDKRVDLAPLQPKKYAKEITQQLRTVIQEESKINPMNDWETIAKRIDNINQPTNKARLRAPFDILGISLLSKDIEILETRNDFLHGRIPDITKSGDKRSLKRKNKDLYYASIRFYTLISILILKWIDFDGYVLNHPKIQEDFSVVSQFEILGVVNKDV